MSKQVPRIVLCTGEKSGDMMLAELAQNLLQLTSYQIDLVAIAQSKTRVMGVPCLIDGISISDVAIIGKNTFLSWEEVYKRVIKLLKNRPPHVFVGITHQGFNIAVAKELNKIDRMSRPRLVMLGAPEIWGWDFRRWIKCVGPSLLPVMTLLGLTRWKPHLKIASFYLDRGRSTLKYYDLIFCLNALETDTYRRLADRSSIFSQLAYKGRIVNAGHPCVRFKTDKSKLDLEKARVKVRSYFRLTPEQQLIGIFPGSRRNPIKIMLPDMLDSVFDVMGTRPELCCAVSIADAEFEPLIMRLLKDNPRSIKFADRLFSLGEEIEPLLSACDYALLSSGTVSLQAACLGIPGVVVYQLRSDFYAKIAKLFAVRKRLGGKPSPFALANALLVDSPKGQMYQECTLSDFSSKNIARHLEEVLKDPFAKEKIIGRWPELFPMIQNELSPEINPMTFVATQILQLARERMAESD